MRGRLHDAAPWRSSAIAITWMALIAGGALRLYGLGDESLWNDELATMARTTLSPISKEFWIRQLGDTHPPGYYLLMSAWTRIAGSSELALRLPSALLGIVAIVLIFRLGRRIFGAPVGAVAALLASVSPLLVRYSQEARSNSLVAVLAILFAGAMLSTLRTDTTEPETRRRALVWTATLSALLSYTHYAGFLVVFTLYAFGFLHALRRRDPGRAKVLLHTGILAAILYLPWMYGLARHMKLGGLDWLQTPTFGDLLAFPTTVLPAFVFVLAALFAVAVRAEPVRGAADEPDRLGVELLLFWFFAMVGGMWLKSLISMSIFIDRNLIVVAPPLIILVAAAASWRRPARASYGWGIAVMAMVAVFFVTETRYYAERTKADVRGAAARAARWLESDPHLPVVARASEPEFYRYYLERQGAPADLRLRSAPELHQLATWLREHRSRDQKVILLITHRGLPPRLAGVVRQSFEIVESTEHRGAGAYLLAPR